MKYASIIIGVAIFITAGAGVYASLSSRGHIQTKAELVSFTVQKPYFVVQGIGLSSVEIIGVPTGTNVDSSLYVSLGYATESSENVWKLPIPSNELLLTSIFAKGTDTKGGTTTPLYLPETGATALYDLLWAKSTTDGTSQTVTLSLGKSATVFLSNLRLLSIEEDSRCPLGVFCIQAGMVRATVALTENGTTTTRVISSSGVNNIITLGSLSLKLDSVYPVKRQGEVIPKNTYRLTFFIEKSLSSSGLEGKVLIGPNCPVEKSDVPCPDKPYKTTLHIVGDKDTKDVESETDGMFRVALPPGSYTITGLSKTLPYLSPKTVIVSPHTFTHVDLIFDSGIR